MAKTRPTQASGIRDRIKEFRRVKASDLLPNPKNFRRHPESQQKALRSVLEAVGYADAAIAYETEAGLVLIDGHLRQSLTPEQEIPVLVLDVNEQEADLLLASLDPLAAMAQTDAAALGSLLEALNADESMQELLDSIADETGINLKDDETGDGRKSLNNQGSPTVRVVLNVSDVTTFERAIAATGKINRAEAMMEICEAYLGEEG